MANPGSEALLRTFHDLMPYRIREVLLVSSEYDAFILEEDGWLTEKIFLQYSELSLSTAPRIMHAATTEEAMGILEIRPVDLVITMVRLDNMDFVSLGRRVKELHPGMPVVLLAFSEAEIAAIGPVDPGSIDDVFVWTGDPRILLAIIKQLEDRQNAPHDTAAAGIRVILFVEDSVMRYSSLLAILYPELMSQAQSLVAEGVNDLHRRTRLQARPKLLHATDYEQALEFLERYQEHMMAMISDVRLPRGGELDGEAGFRLVTEVRARIPELPILLQSSEPENAPRAAELKVGFIGKKTEMFQHVVQRFLAEDLGFGPFVFRLPDYSEVARARTALEMERVLPTIPASCVEYHASRNDFSTWLIARSFFGVARELQSRKSGDFEHIEELRDFLVRALAEDRRHQHRGVITDYSPDGRLAEADFLRLGGGSLGGKARSLAFVNKILGRRMPSAEFPEFEVTVPRTLVLATDVFDGFMEKNRLLPRVHELEDDSHILRTFLEADFPWGVERDIKNACETLVGPLAVRSSSLLEDSSTVPFAGIYATFMLPNNHPDPHFRKLELCRAVKAVYASAFTRQARAYIQGTSFAFEDEKLGVAIQQVAGERHGPRFYPDFSGVAMSYNFYPLGRQRPEQGLVTVALGMGYQIASGGQALQFCPASPKVLPQCPAAVDYLRASQQEFWAVDLESLEVDLVTGAEGALVQCPLSVAEEDGTLAALASTYEAANDALRDGLFSRGRRVVSFRNILRWRMLPLAPLLERLLGIFRTALGGPVEIEFAVNMPPRSRLGSRRAEKQQARMSILQVRPQGMYVVQERPRMDSFVPEDVFLRTSVAKGHGVLTDIRDVVHVRNRSADGTRTPEIARQVGEFNARLVAEARGYLLVGPGRWGSSDRSLGIPVDWSQINGARVIVETSFQGRVVEPSQGSHFFHNLMSRRIGYLTLPLPSKSASREQGTIDRDWLERQEVVAEGEDVTHHRLPEPLHVILDGPSSSAVVLKRYVPEDEVAYHTELE